MSSLDDAIRPLALWLTNHALHSTLLLLLAWGVAARLRSAALRGLVWRFALVGGLLTATAGSLVGSRLIQVELSPSPAAELATANGAPLALEAAPGSSSPTGDLATSAAQPASPATTAGTSETRWLARWPLVVVLLWLVCAGFGVTRWRRARRELARHASRREPLDDARVRARLDRVLLRSGWRGPVTLSVCPGLPSPIALGSDEICLPAEAAELSDAALDALLAHECAHLARRDPRWLSIAHLVEGVFAYLPLHRLARRRLTAEAELASDAWAARTTGEPLQLARCLAEVADWMGDRPLPATVSAMARRGSELVHRVEVLVDGTPVDPAPRQLRAFTGAALLALVAFACGAPTVGEPGDQDTEQPKINARLESRRSAATSAIVQVDSAGMTRVESESRPPSGPYDLNSKDGLAALRVELAAIAAEMPRETIGNMDLPAGELRILVESGARYSYVQKIMAECGGYDVQIWKLAVAAAESPGEFFEVPLPVDLHVDGDPGGETVELRIRVSDRTGESRVSYATRVKPGGFVEEQEEEESLADDFFIGGPAFRSVEDLAGLEARLKEAFDADPSRTVTIDARSGTVYTDVVEVLDLVTGIGYQQVVFIGSYE